MTYTVFKQIATLMMVIFAIRQGFLHRNEGVVLSWPMFSRFSCFRMDLKSEESGLEINPWKYMIHIDFAGHRLELDELLAYLREQHSIIATGSGIIVDAKGYHEIHVRGGHVADR